MNLNHDPIYKNLKIHSLVHNNEASIDNEKSSKLSSNFITYTKIFNFIKKFLENAINIVNLINGTVKLNGERF